MLWINLLGGSAVIGSYVLWLAGRANAADALWGGVPGSVRPFYTAGMLLAAAGYFMFSCFLLFRIDPATAKVFGCCDARFFHLLYLGILIPSALWMPVTFWAVESRSVPVVCIVRIILILVALFRFSRDDEYPAACRAVFHFPFKQSSWMRSCGGWNLKSKCPS
jgi:hypothetical protein